MKKGSLATIGGIGPTHDDMTTQAIAEAFGTPVELNKEAYALIKDFYNQLGQELNPAREKMAYLPRGSSLINNPVSTAPGFSLGNVYVLPGVPNIMQAMLEQLLPSLKHGTPIQSKHIDFMAGESLIAVELELMQNNYPEIEISSYPFKVGEDHATSIVLRSYNLNNLEEVYQKLYSLVKSFTA